MSLISTIDLGCSQSFESPFLTVDVDWAHDEILEDAIDLVKYIMTLKKENLR